MQRTSRQGDDRGPGFGHGGAGWVRSAAAAMLAAGVLALGGCVSVNAPDKPIVIELNINIKQEVVYRLTQDAGKTIDKNAEIF
ncbi:MAG: YnbE family lipoprotein [Sphingomonadales bacterium]|nr:YnbE family lipoprotein [Sphingomonadales bacterium]